MKHLQRTLLEKQKDRFVLVFDGRASGGNLQLAIREGLESVSLLHSGKYKDTADSLLNTLGKVAPARANSMLGTGDEYKPTLDFNVKLQASSEIASLKKIIKAAQEKHLIPVFLFD